jgi:DNA-binding PadR family transcriptional regulator
MDANELLLLGLLDRQEMHGYRLHEFLEHQLQFVSDLKRPTAYRLLEQLHRQGLVERASEREGRRPERMIYRVTQAGRARFDELLRLHLATAGRTIYPGNVALLFSERISPEERRSLLQKRLAGVEEQWRVLEPAVEAHSPNTPARLALEHDLAHLQVEARWLAATIERIETEVPT